MPIIRVAILGAGGHAKVVAYILGDAFCGFEDQNQALAADGYALGIGDNTRRRLVYSKESRPIVSAIHDSAIIAPDVNIGIGTVVMPGAIINSGVRLGKGSIINSGAIVEHDCIIGDFAHIGPGASLAGGVEVGEGALVGIGACAIQGKRIGAWSIVGAGAVVVTDVPERATAKGVPAKW